MSIDCHLYAIALSRITQVESDYLSGKGFISLRGSLSCDIHKAWHAIHFLLTGTSEEGSPPHNMLLYGGKEIGESDEDEMIDPPRILSVAETVAFNNIIQPIDHEELKKQFDHKGMVEADVYSIHGSDDFDDDYEEEFSNIETTGDYDLEEQDDFEFVEHFFNELRHFMDEVVREGKCVIIQIG